MSKALDDIAAERQRQIVDERFTAEHDDEHPGGEMAMAAGCYAITAGLPKESVRIRNRYWPWFLDWWKPSTPRRDLVKAGALIVAEIERLDRAGGG